MLLTLLVVLSVAVVLFVAASLATSDRAVLADAPPDDPDDGLPLGWVGPGDVRDVRFSLALRGYRMAEVDDVLARLAEELALRDARVDALEHAIAEAVEPAVAAGELRAADDERERAREQAAADLAAAQEQVDQQAAVPGEPAVDERLELFAEPETESFGEPETVTMGEPETVTMGEPEPEPEPEPETEPALQVPAAGAVASWPTTPAAAAVTPPVVLTRPSAVEPEAETQTDTAAEPYDEVETVIEPEVEPAAADADLQADDTMFPAVSPPEDAPTTMPEATEATEAQGRTD